MNIANITKNIATGSKKAFYAVRTFMQVNEPTLWAVTGGVCLIGGTVMACMATRKLDDILYNQQFELYDAEDKFYDEETQTTPDTKEYRKARFDIRMRTIGEIAKAYAPAVATEVVGTVCICKGYNVLNNRAADALAAYISLDTAFKEYRERVAAEQGAEKDREYMNGIEEGYSKSNDEDIPPEGFSPSLFTFHFNPMTSPLYSPWDTGDDTKHENLALFRRTKEQMDQRLDIKGHLFVNEVLDELCINRTPAGALCGWISHEYPTEGAGEVYFDIRDSIQYFPNAPQGPGYYRDYIFTLNPDPGVIWNKVVG